LLGTEESPNQPLIRFFYWRRKRTCFANPNQRWRTKSERSDN